MRQCPIQVLLNAEQQHASAADPAAFDSDVERCVRCILTEISSCRPFFQRGASCSWFRLLATGAGTHTTLAHPPPPKRMVTSRAAAGVKMTVDQSCFAEQSCKSSSKDSRLCAWCYLRTAAADRPHPCSSRHKARAAACHEKG
jgi:hypothetical protein